MKKTIIIALLSLALGLVEKGNAQSVGASMAYGKGQCGVGGTTCVIGISVPASRSVDETKLSLHLMKDASGHIVMQISKANLTEEQERLNYKNKFAFYIEEDVILEDSVREALDSEKPIVIKQGMYPIIEWENYYYIRF